MDALVLPHLVFTLMADVPHFIKLWIQIECLLGHFLAVPLTTLWTFTVDSSPMQY